MEGVLGILAGRQWLIESAGRGGRVAMSFNARVRQSCSLSYLGQTQGLKDGRDGEPMRGGRGSRHLYFLHPAKSQLMLEKKNGPVCGVQS